METHAANGVTNNSKGEGICVGIRMRPLNDREILSGQDKIFKCVPHCNAITHINSAAESAAGQTFYYDKVLSIPVYISGRFNTILLGFR